MVLTFTAPCFSGECGFCPSCCDLDPISKDHESIQRAYDLKKFIGSQRIQEEQDKYNKSLKKITKKYDYHNPTDIGFMPPIIKFEKGQPIDYVKYNLIKGNHTIICDDLLCKVFFIISHDGLRSSYYSKLPIYNRNHDKNHNLCAVCINR